MKKFTSLFESTSEERSLLFDKISNLKNWLYQSNGLGMMSIIDDIFEENGYCQKITMKEVAQFEYGLDILKKTSMSLDYINQQLSRKLPGGILNAKLVKDKNGDWDYVNKLNTNYSDLSDLLTELIMRGMHSNPERGKAIYDSIINNPTDGLLALKPHLKKLIVKYFIENGNGLDDFKSFTKFSRKMSNIGELCETKITDKLASNGFEIKYRGGNGDFIDMLFGTDIIVYRDDFGFKTIQVKNTIYWNRVDYYQVDWIGDGQSLKLYDRINRKEIDFIQN